MRKTGVVVILLIALSAFLCHADTAVKEDGREIGQGFRRLSKEAGTAFKEGGRESGQAAKKAGRSVGEWFRDMGRSIKSFFNDRFGTTK